MRPLVVALTLFLTVIGIASSVNEVSDGSVATSSSEQKSETEQINYEFSNGLWFNGKSFTRRTFYSVNGILKTSRPARIDSVIDLGNKYVIPPFSEAHNHNVGGRDGLSELINTYLSDGIFYVKNPNSIRRQSAEVLDMVNTRSSIDFTYANGGLTATGGHPIKLYEDLVKSGNYPGWTEKQMENEAYFVINDLADLNGKWESILAGKPRFIKTYLLYSEEYDKRKNDPAFFGSKGLNPALLPEIVKKAHQAGLRVTTHVETAADFHNAVIARIDEVAHVPGYFVPKGDDLSRYAIAEADAKLAGRMGIFVVTTTVISTRIFARVPEQLRQIQINQKRNIELLAKHGVNLAIGSDAWWTTSLAEALNLYQLKIFNNLTLLKIWCESTPKTIFPGRKIGYLKPDYEASFLVLDENPLEDVLNVKKIYLRVKQGNIIHLE